MRRKRKQNYKKFDFSKIILAAVMITYEIAVIYGFVVVSSEYSLLPELLTFIGAPTAVAIGFYSWKAKAENIRKIDKSAYRKFVAKGDDTDDSF